MARKATATMFMRTENLLGSLDGICASCNTEQNIPFVDVWYAKILYKSGTCPSCAYDHWVPVRRA